MEFKEILELIQAVSDSSLTEFKIDNGDLKLSMKTDKGAQAVPMMVETCSVPMQTTAPQPMVQTSAPQAETVAEPVEIQGNVMKAPLVGTFYAAGSPDAEPFVKVGDVVKKGQTLGIVEAMKLMNEIESEFDGTIAEILVENESVVEYGQPMFVIK